MFLIYIANTAYIVFEYEDVDQKSCCMQNRKLMNNNDGACCVSN